jgi:hypothetical protein
MIIIRQKGCKEKLAHVLNFPHETWYFTNTIFNAKVVDIIFFDKTIQHAMYMGGKGDVFRHVGRLEDNNIPFIILIDKKCKVRFSSSAPATVINAECLDRSTLECSISDETKKSNKEDMFNTLFQDFIRANSNVPFKKNFAHFMMSAAQAELYLKALVFITMSSVDGEILNANKDVGKSFADGTIWFSKEDEYIEQSKIAMVEMVETSPTDTLAHFSEVYEAGRYIDWGVISKYSEDELVLIICKYPTLFSDFMTFGWSRYDPVYYISGGDDETTEDDGRFSVDANGIIEYKEDIDVLEKYYDDDFKCEPGTRLCYICDNYFDEKQMCTIFVSTEKSQSVAVKACVDCNHI